MKTIDFSYFIERYNAGEMDQTEKKWFEKELGGNETLRKEVILRRRVDNAMIQHDLLELRTKLINLEKERKERALASEGKRSVGIRYAAAIATLMLIGSLFFINSGNMDTDTLYKSFNKQYEIKGAGRTASFNGDTEYSRAISQFENGNYSEAAILFSEFLKKQPSNMDAHFMNGVAKMENENFTGAKSSFNIVINDNNNLFVDNAKWRLALCFIKTKEIPEAKQLLEAIINSESSFKKEAKKALRKL